MKTWFYLVSVVIVVLVNKLIKIILLLSHHEKLSFKNLTRSGDMPSDHSAIVSAITTSLALVNGLDHPLFALSLVFASLVIYDAMHVRLSSGEQGEALNKLLAKKKEDLIEVHLGHEPIEVYVGTLIGVVLPLLIFQFYQIFF